MVNVRRLQAFAIVAALVVSRRSIDGEHLGSATQRPAFRSGVDVIAMSVTVTDGSRRYGQDDLDRPDFHVFEDGRPQQVTFFQKGSLPLALALLIDTSASMELNLAVAQEAAIGLVRRAGSGRRGGGDRFRHPRAGASGFHERSRRRSRGRSVRRRRAGRRPSITPIYIALKDLNKTVLDETLAQSRRRAMVILSDGEDTSSLVAYEEVLGLAARSDVAIYAIGLLGREGPGVEAAETEAQFVLRRFAERASAGGRSFRRM